MTVREQIRALALAGVLAGGLGQANAANLSTAFSYQGRLVAGGSPANGAYDLQLALFDASVAGNQIGVSLTNPAVWVSNGLFTTTVDFGAGLFDGTTYWIEVSVRPGGLAAEWRKLQPRQRLAGTPYALYSANSGNASHADTATSATSAAGVPWTGLSGVPAGFADGMDNDTLYAAGAGLALLDHEFNVIFAGTGMANTAARSDHKHTAADLVSGTLPEGRIDPLIARDAEILPAVLGNDGKGSGLDADFLDGLDAGAFWKLGGNAGTVPRTDTLGTTDNQALELVVNSARVLRLEPNGSSPNIIAGAAINAVRSGVAGATIGGGGTLDDGTGAALTNRVNAAYGTVSGGLGNAAGSLGSVIGGGRNNRVEILADYAVVGGGNGNTIQTNADYATIPGGFSASAGNYGQLAYASGSFAAPGDAQSSLYLVRGVTSTSVPVNLTLDGLGQHMRIPVGGRWAYEILVLGAMTGASTNTAAYQIRGAIRNIAGTTTLIPGAPSVVSFGADPGSSWAATAVADDVLDALVVRVFGPSLGTVRWVATVRTTELIFP